MFYIFFGTDEEASRTALKKEIVGNALRFDAGNWVEEEVLSSVLGAELFGESVPLLLDGVLEKEGVSDFISTHAKDLVSSPRSIYLRERSLLSPLLKKLEKAGAAIKEFKGVAKKPERFKIFALADALGERNKKELWKLYQSALKAGLNPEEIGGTLFWQLKTILIEGQGGNLNPFVASKARRYQANFKKGEVASLAGTLITFYHEAHRGGASLELSLEKFILSL